jgi:hypothetical protein
MQDHFPYFLVYFPETAWTLSRELAGLREAPKRAAVWEKLIMLFRQQHDSQEWDLLLEAEYELTLEHFLGTIPGNSALVSCCVYEEYLRAAVEDVIAYDAVREPFKPYGAKLLRCAPGNLIILGPDFTPWHYYDERTTDAHRRQVDNYVKQVRSLDNGKHRPRDMDEVAFRFHYPLAYQKVRDEKDRTGGKVLKRDVAAELLQSPKTFKRNLDRYTVPWPPI